MPLPEKLPALAGRVITRSCAVGHWSPPDLALPEVGKDVVRVQVSHRPGGGSCRLWKSIITGPTRCGCACCCSAGSRGGTPSPAHTGARRTQALLQGTKVHPARLITYAPPANGSARCRRSYLPIPPPFRLRRLARPRRELAASEALRGDARLVVCAPQQRCFAPASSWSAAACRVAGRLS